MIPGMIKSNKRMRDQTSILRIEKLHPAVRDIFKRFIEEAEETLDIKLRVTQGLRTFAEQDALYAQGRTKPGGIVTKAKGGQSFHNYGLAIDLVEIRNGKANWDFDYRLLLPFAQKYNLTWGGNFKSIVDKPHYELTFGNSFKQLLTKYNNKQFIKGTQYVQL